VGAPSVGVRRRSWSWKVALALVTTVVVVASLSFVVLRRAPPLPHTLAVLPFKPLVAESRDPVLEFGMTDTLITQLSHAGGVAVAPLSSVRRFASVDQDPVAAARQLGVESVLEGHVHREGDRLRVSVRLLDVQTGRPRWAHRFDERFRDIFSVQDDIAASVAGALPGDVVDRSSWEKRRATQNSEAYQFYVAGRAQSSERTPPSLQRAVGYYEQAIARDPQYSLAYASMADCYAVLGVFDVLSPEDSFSKARAAAQRALELDPELAEAHATMGHIKVQYDRDWAGGEAAYRKAIELDPQYPMSYHWLGLLFAYRGEFDQALEYMRTAQELEPSQKVFSANIGNILYHAHRYDEAIEQFQHTLSMDSQFELALTFLGRTYLRKGDPKRALELFNQRRFPIKGGAADLVEAYARQGRLDLARARLSELQESAKARYVSAYEFATAYEALGEHEIALDWLERGFEEHAQGMGHLPTDPAFDTLHDNDRFIELVQKLGLH
jgi:TolB-like protein/Tfp pilus assembly protein PilF